MLGHMPVIIKTLDPNNMHLLNKSVHDVFDYAIDPLQLAAFVEDPRHLMAVAVENETVVGMASGVECFHPDKQPQLFINEVGVASTHRRQGIGRELVMTLIASAKKRGCTSAWLGTDSDNVAGQACFGSVPGGGEPQPFLLYEWDLVE